MREKFWKWIGPIMAKSPFKVKMFLAKLFVRCLTVEHAPNDMVLFNELTLWIETAGRPTTSNPNYWINKAEGK